MKNIEKLMGSGMFIRRRRAADVKDLYNKDILNAIEGFIAQDGEVIGAVRTNTESLNVIQIIETKRLYLYSFR